MTAASWASCANSPPTRCSSRSSRICCSTARVGQQTDVVTLNAELLEALTDGDSHWASVRFSGMIRESPDAQPEAFQEVWNLAKPTSGASGWVLAGIQQRLQ